MSGWTDERIETLKQMWADKGPASRIGAAIGVSKNAVIGMRKRLDLPARREGRAPIPQPQERKPQTFSGKRFFIAPCPKPSRKLALRPQTTSEAPAPLMLDLLDLTERTCKWPVTNAVPHRFCGHEKQSGVPYCDFHRCRASARMVGS